MTEPTSQEIWGTLSKIDCSKHVEKKGSLSYLSWAWAWATMMERYPEMVVEWEPTHYEPDESATVGCEVRIGSTVRYMWLPVMDNRNKAISKPSSRDISDARMRCLVKCFALFGLAHYLYAGEDIPQADAGASDELLNTAEGLFIRAGGLGIDEHKLIEALGSAIKQKDKNRLEKGIPLVRKLIEQTEAATNALDLEKAS